MGSATMFMETTAINPDRTIAEIEAVLVRYGVTTLLKEYQNGAIESVAFKAPVNGVQIPFRIPCRWQAIETVLKKRKAGKWNYSLSEVQKRDIAEKARRIAWRQILRWIEAQMALVETSMVKLEEVFFPYIQARGGQTIFELQEAKGLLMIGGGE